jgi:hypothetical protein
MKRIKKTLAVVISAALIITSIPPREVEASWFSDLMGGLFTVITSPILLFAKDNPTLRKNNPFRKKIWEEEAEKEEKQKLVNKREERFRKYQEETLSTIASLQDEIKELRSMVTCSDSKLDDKKILETVKTVVIKNKHLLKGDKGNKGDTGAAGKDGNSCTPEELAKAYNTSPAVKNWIDDITDDRIKQITGENQTTQTPLKQPSECTYVTNVEEIERMDERYLTAISNSEMTSYILTCIFLIIVKTTRKKLCSASLMKVILPVGSLLASMHLVKIAVKYRGYKYGQDRLEETDTWLLWYDTKRFLLYAWEHIKGFIPISTTSPRYFPNFLICCFCY